MFFGSNDASKDASQHVPLPRYKENLTYIVNALQAAGAKVVLVGPAVHDEVHRHQMFQGDPALNPRSTLKNLEYANAGAQLAGELGVPFIDLWRSFLASVGWKEGDPIPGKLGDETDLSVRHLLNDGLHFTGAGYKVWYDEFVKVISQQLPEFTPSEIPFLFPEYSAFATPSTVEKIFKDKAV